MQRLIEVFFSGTPQTPLAQQWEARGQADPPVIEGKRNSQSTMGDEYVFATAQLHINVGYMQRSLDLALSLGSANSVHETQKNSTLSSPI